MTFPILRNILAVQQFHISYWEMYFLNYENHGFFLKLAVARDMADAIVSDSDGPSDLSAGVEA